MKYLIISMKGACGQNTEEKCAEEFVAKLNAFVSDGYELVQCEFPNGPNSFRYYALLKNVK